VQYKKFDTNNTIDTADCIDLKVIDPHTQNMSKSILMTELWTFNQKLHNGIQEQFGNHHKTKAYLHIFTPHDTQILEFYCK
jgi:hypothetical protein